MTRSRLLLMLLVLVGLAGIAVLLRSRMSGRHDVDVRNAPVVPRQEAATGEPEGLPVAGTASTDGGLGAAAMQR
jgi:hypothetical protein